MTNIDNYIKKCNLVFTNTCDSNYFCRYDFDINKVEVDYGNSISLFDLFSSFNELYLEFKNEYEKLEKLNLGKDIEIISFNNFSLNGDNYRVLKLYINESSIRKHSNTFLYLREINNELRSFVTNDKSIYDKGYYHEEIHINEEIGRKYLDLFEKYNSLLIMYDYFKHRRIFGDGTSSIFTVIDCYNSNLSKGLNNIRILISSDYGYTDFLMDLSIRLGTIFDIDQEKCKLFLDNKCISLDSSVFYEMLNKIFINKNYLIDRYSSEDANNIIKNFINDFNQKKIKKLK